MSEVIGKIGTRAEGGKDNLGRFLRFHRANPKVWKMFRSYALQAIASGKKHYSHWLIMGRVRWELDVVRRGDDAFKINNNHFAYYARLFEEVHPEHRGFFETRQLKGK